MYEADHEVGWDIYDHLKVMPNPGGYTLVMDPIFVGPANNVKFTKVLINSDSSINILYQDSMHNLGIKDNMLEPSKTTFHGILSGLSYASMGKIRIDVMFKSRANYWVENLLFEVGIGQVHGKYACGIPKDEDARTKWYDHHCR
jgi:hypothetical protein